MQDYEYLSSTAAVTHAMFLQVSPSISKCVNSLGSTQYVTSSMITPLFANKFCSPPKYPHHICSRKNLEYVYHASIISIHISYGHITDSKHTFQLFNRQQSVTSDNNWNVLKGLWSIWKPSTLAFTLLQQMCTPWISTEVRAQRALSVGKKGKKEGYISTSAFTALIWGRLLLVWLKHSTTQTLKNRQLQYTQQQHGALSTSGAAAAILSIVLPVFYLCSYQAVKLLNRPPFSFQP